jgi:hypothetical protein
LTTLIHIPTTNPIESTFSTVRLRHGETNGNGSRAACLTMVYCQRALKPGSPAGRLPGRRM